MPLNPAWLVTPNMDKFIEYTVPPEHDGQAVKSLLRQQLHVSAGLLSRLKLHPQGITLDGERVTVRAVTRAGQQLRILAETGGAAATLPVPGELDIVHEDTHMLIINKPAGLVVHPSRGHYEDTLANRVAFYLGAKAPIRAINRLDKGTSGLLCLAKSAYSAQILSRQMAQGHLSREYVAVLDGTGLPQRGTIDAPIARAPGRGIMREVREDGQRAVTHFELVCEGTSHSLVRLRLETGRTHQIRVHFAHIGMPVAGDFMYGNELEWLHGHALHSEKLGLLCPQTCRALELYTPPPGYFDELIQK